MRFLIKCAAAMLLALGVAVPASAELAVGDRAPNFATKAARAGTEFGFNLTLALRQGPVVLYFYPKAFTSGCTLEANAFAEAIDDFKAAGASVIGMSNDDIDTLKRFSREECRDAFPVGVAGSEILGAFDVGTQFARRTSYVIGQDGKVAFVYSNSDWRGHVRETLAAVRALSN